MKTHGLPHEIVPNSWADILAQFEGLAATSPQFDPLVAIVQSIIESGSSTQLAATTSMHDLIVVTSPPPALPKDALRISVSGSLQATSPGQVRIQHLSVSGHNDDISRPESEAVRLFWRFVSEKFGMAEGKTK